MTSSSTNNAQIRVGIAGFSHESNTFSVLPTNLADFRILEGQAILDNYAQSFHELGGYIAAATEFDFELIPLLTADATPSGPVSSEAYEAITERILTAIEHTPNLDGVLLALHGAMVSEGYLQADGETVRRVRALLGSDFPLIVTHDYHGNIPPQLVEDADALIVYKTCPHIDQKERGLQAADLLMKMIRDKVRPTSAITKPDVLFNIIYHNTNHAPMGPLMQAAIDLEKEPGILACSIAAGYQYADVPEMGPSIVVVTDNDPERAQREADRLGEMMWAIRDQLQPNVPDAETAIRQALSTEGTVGLFEIGDNVGGGSAADATVILEALLRLNIDRWVVSLYDPDSVQACFEAGVGATLSLEVGGKVDDSHGPTLSLTGQIRSLHDGKFIETERRHGGQRYFDQGLTAVFAVDQTSPETGGHIILTSYRITPMSLNQIRSLGIMPEQQKILVAKGTVAPRAAYEPVCNKIIEVDTSGATSISRSPDAFENVPKRFYEWRKS
ncbi:MAG: M81 family metallopeptidase [Chloroflexota bacterium]